MNPLRLPWRKFTTLLAQLPGDSAFVSALRAEQDENEQISLTGIRSELDRMAGREPAQDVQRVPLDVLLKSAKRQ